MIDLSKLEERVILAAVNTSETDQGESSLGEVKELVEKMGGKVTGSVTKKTNYLINNDVESASSKNRKAKELGVPIISEEEFIELAGVEIE